LLLHGVEQHLPAASPGIHSGLPARADTSSGNVMEAGLIFPGLGQEQQWFGENRARLAELGII
jgi:hypothetical protein